MENNWKTIYFYKNSNIELKANEFLTEKNKLLHINIFSKIFNRN